MLRTLCICAFSLLMACGGAFAEPCKVKRDPYLIYGHTWLVEKGMLFDDVWEIARLAGVKSPVVCLFTSSIVPLPHVILKGSTYVSEDTLFFPIELLTATSRNGRRGVLAHEISHIVRGPTLKAGLFSIEDMLNEERAVDDHAALLVGKETVRIGLAEVREHYGTKVRPEEMKTVDDRIDRLR